MRVVQLLGDCRAEVRDAPDPSPPDEGVVVALRASALCGSELGAYRAADVRPSLVNVGHEAVGVVVDASRSRRWRVGDRVGVYAVWGCGACERCREGIPTYCAQWRVQTGMHAEYVAAPDRVLLPLPEGIDFASASLLCGDALGVPFHASRHLRTRGGDVVVVVGCGPVGQASVLVQRHFGATVVALDVQAARRERALALGASVALDPSAGQEDAVERVRSLTRGRLADAAIEASGTPAGVALALRLAGPGCPVALCGEVGGVTLNVSQDFIRTDRLVFGSWYYHQRDFPRMVRLWRRGLPLETLISHGYRLEQAAEAMATFAAGGATGKVVLQIGSDE